MTLNPKTPQHQKQCTVLSPINPVAIVCSMDYMSGVGSGLPLPQAEVEDKKALGKATVSSYVIRVILG